MRWNSITLLLMVIFRCYSACLPINANHFSRCELTACSWRVFHMTKQGLRCSLRWKIRRSPMLLHCCRVHSCRAVIALPTLDSGDTCLEPRVPVHRPERCSGSLMPWAFCREETLTAMGSISWGGPPLYDDIVSQRQSLTEYYYVKQFREHTHIYLIFCHHIDDGCGLSSCQL